jgi:hypothetical protein
MRENWRVCFLLVGRPYACSVAADFARLLSRICSLVKPSPQTLHRQPGERRALIPGGC